MKHRKIYCKCHDTLTIKQSLNAFKDEVIEFIVEPSKDEASDIVYCINRLAGSITNRPYLRIIPGDKLHKDKIGIRMDTYGCIRSRNHLINGKCPSLPNKQ